MDSSNAEKAWQDWAATLKQGTKPALHETFLVGWRAHDAEAAVPRERVAELEAAVQGVADLADKAEHGALRWADPLPVPEWVPRVRAVLSSPSEVLAAVRREAVQEYIERKETPKMLVEFTNQPVFDALVRDKQREAWDAGYDRAESDHWGTGFWAKGKRANPYAAGGNR